VTIGIASEDPTLRDVPDGPQPEPDPVPAPAPYAPAMPTPGPAPVRPTEQERP
jgi:hypothetical protein